MGLNKKMLDKDFELMLDKFAEQVQLEMMEEDYQNQIQLHIEEVLEEAGRWGMRQEVYESAQQQLQENPSIDVITAYNQAFSEFIK